MFITYLHTKRVFIHIFITKFLIIHTLKKKTVQFNSENNDLKCKCSLQRYNVARLLRVWSTAPTRELIRLRQIA